MLLQCLGKKEARKVMVGIHEGFYGAHLLDLVMAIKINKMGYY